MKKDKVIIFVADAEQRTRLEGLAKGLGKSQAQVLRELIDSATLVQPVLVSTFNQSAGYEKSLVQHV